VSRRAWIVFAGVSALWGAPYLLIKIAVHDLSPTVIACSRTAIGAIALLPLAQRSGAVRPIRDRWRWLLLLAAVEMAVPFTLITAGERHIASSLAGILVSAAPLFVALFAIRVAPAERPRGVAVFGLVAGFADVVVLLGAHVSGNGSEFLSAGAVLLAAALYAAAGHVLRARFADAPPIGVMSVVMALAALILAIPAAASLPSSFPSLPTCAAVLGLGVGCTGLAFLGFATLTKEVGVGRASLVAYVAPVFAVALGVVFRSEPVSWTTFAGMALILGGSWAAARRPALPAPAAQRSAWTSGNASSSR
jgi:drug/metabolite transporter (DMT)-like permease